MGITVAVGCPVAHRGWILDAWFDHVETAFERAGVEPIYVFVGDHHRDHSFDVIERRATNAVLDYAPNTRPQYQRNWDQPRYWEMVGLRNQLLGIVRDLDVPHFLSLDSDILLHPDTMRALLNGIDVGAYDALGGKCFMTVTGTKCPSWAKLSPQGSLQRHDATGTFPVDVIMAIKLMNPSAYRIDYEAHSQGEDTGWSIACRRAGLALGWCGAAPSKHVMAPHLLGSIDPRVGF